MKDYLVKSFEKSLNERKEYYLYDIPIFILNPFSEEIKIDDVVEEITNIIPYKFLKGLEGVYVGDFPELKDRDIHAMLKDDAIYLSSILPDDESVSYDLIVSDVVHEIAHLLENKQYYEIYGDKEIETEYLGKKKRLVDLLRANGISFHGMGKLFFSEEHVDELDNFLYDQIGYDKIIPLTVGLFTSPYSVTSLREYFANGFEEYLSGDKDYLKEISPSLYIKIEFLIKGE